MSCLFCCSESIPFENQEVSDSSELARSVFKYFRIKHPLEMDSAETRQLPVFCNSCKSICEEFVTLHQELQDVQLNLNMKTDQIQNIIRNTDISIILTEQPKNDSIWNDYQDVRRQIVRFDAARSSSSMISNSTSRSLQRKETDVVNKYNSSKQEQDPVTASMEVEMDDIADEDSDSVFIKPEPDDHSPAEFDSGFTLDYAIIEDENYKMDFNVSHEMSGAFLCKTEYRSSSDEKGDEQNSECGSSESSVRVHKKEGDTSKWRDSSETLNNTSEYSPQQVPSDKKFPCAQCGKGFNSNWKLQRHARTHSSDSGVCYLCQQCKKRFKTEERLEKHVQYHVNEAEKLYGCDRCEIRFVTKLLLETHEKEHYVPKCAECSETFQSKTEYMRHRNEVHKNLKCLECGKSFHSKWKLQRHLRTHKLDHGSPYRCQQCKRRFKSEQRLEKHTNYHADEAERPYGCDRCEIRFVDKQALETHLQGHFVHKCADCSETFKDRTEFDRHRASFHKKYSCSQCGKDFPSKWKLERHSRTHNADKESLYDCNQCEKRFKTEHRFERHLKYHAEEGEKPYGCDRCEVRFCDKKNLTSHNKGHPVLECQECSEKFKNTIDYNRHRASFHKNFSCPQCGKDFPSNWKLQRHSRTHKSDGNTDTVLNIVSEEEESLDLLDDFNS